MSRTADPTARVLAALADPVRLSIVRQLSQACDVCACDFDVEGRLAQPTVSHHLRVLREAGCIRAERRGTYIHYTLDPALLGRLTALVQSLLPPTVDPSELASGRRLPVVATPVPDHG